MDKDLDGIMILLISALRKEYPELSFKPEKILTLSKIVSDLSAQHPKIAKEFSSITNRRYIKPDGGFLYAIDKKGNTKLILVAEMKRQGTNDKRAKEGLPKQSQGNAVERLGKNLIAIRALLKNESILPFVCFGSGYDFRDGSYIRDRVVTMNDFFPLNKIFVNKQYAPFEPVSMFFREKDWSGEEIFKILADVADEAIHHYFK